MVRAFEKSPRREILRKEVDLLKFRKCQLSKDFLVRDALGMGRYKMGFHFNIHSIGLFHSLLQGMESCCGYPGTRRVWTVLGNHMSLLDSATTTISFSV